jgi:hypothetical protein
VAYPVEEGDSQTQALATKISTKYLNPYVTEDYLNT